MGTTNTPPGPTLQAPLAPAVPGKDPDKPKITKISWDQTEAFCGDEVKLTIETEHMSGMSVMLAVVRSAAVRKILDLIQQLISGGSVKAKWVTRRGPHQPTVKLKAKATGLGGPKESSNELEVKGVPDVKEIFQEERTADHWERVQVPVGTRHVTRIVIHRDHYGWNCHYERKIENGALYITKKVNFLPTSHPVTRAAPPSAPSPARKAKWKAEIESAWDKKFKLHREKCLRGPKCDCNDCGGCTFPIRVVCEWGPGHGKAVSLFPGANDPNGWGTDAWWYSHDWWEKLAGVPPGVRAHEFGHLIGMYDEYFDGAIDPAARTATATDPRVDDPTSLMNAGSTVYARHYMEYKAWFDKKASAIGRTKLLPG